MIQIIVIKDSTNPYGVIYRDKLICSFPTHEQADAFILGVEYASDLFLALQKVKNRDKEESGETENDKGSD